MIPKYTQVTLPETEFDPIWRNKKNTDIAVLPENSEYRTASHVEFSVSDDTGRKILCDVLSVVRNARLESGFVIVRLTNLRRTVESDAVGKRWRELAGLVDLATKAIECRSQGLHFCDQCKKPLTDAQERVILHKLAGLDIYFKGEN